jgi:hypothetical protein
VATQHQAVSKNYFKNIIFKGESDSKCQLCKQHEETVFCLISGCPIVIKKEK